MEIIKLNSTNLLPKYTNKKFIEDEAVSQLKTNAIYKECYFTNAHLKGESIQLTVFENCIFENITYEDCNIQLSSFTSNHFISCKYIECDAPYSGFNNTKWDDCFFSSCVLSHSRFLSSFFTNLIFEDCNIDSVLFDISYENIEEGVIQFLHCNTEEAFFEIN